MKTYIFLFVADMTSIRGVMVELPLEDLRDVLVVYRVGHESGWALGKDEVWGLKYDHRLETTNA